MMPLGITEPQRLVYQDWLFHNHDFAISVDVLQLDHTPKRSLTTTAAGDPLSYVLDGQINLQSGQDVQRTATFTLYDPDHSLHLDADSPWEGAVYADRMLRVRHQVTVPGVGTVTAVPFVGPITKVSRDGDTISVECQDKAALALTGCPPVTVKKGMDATDAIRRVMAQGAGENKFRLPAGMKRNVQKTLSTGWAPEASPWVVASRIAAQVNCQLLYSCDGYLTLRRWPSDTTITVDGGGVTSRPQLDFDATDVANMVRVTGTMAPPKKSNTTKKANPGSEQPTTKLAAVAIAAPSHPLSPQKLGRNGVPRYLPVIIDGAVYKSLAAARALADETLQHDLLLTTGVSFDMVPVFHLDTGDLIAVQTDYGRVVVRLREGSIPLSIGGDMSVGTQRNVSRSKAHNRVTARKWKVKPKKKPAPHHHHRRHHHG
jgi:hypothetical protein